MAGSLKVKEKSGASVTPKTSSLHDKSAAYAGVAQRSARREKTAAAFRTISEVADDLGVKQHVLRFWETKFSQLKPLKRGGGRRYYRPEDIDLLKAVHRLLYTEGYTIKGVQKLLRDAGKKQIVTVFSEDSAPVEPLDSAKVYVEPKQSGVENLTPEQRVTLEAVLAELKDLRGMIKTRR
jgi:DNA-binding transcriptional MerR regulator